VAALAWFGSADYTIMAANPKGGVGKTPLAILIAAAIARHSGSTPILIDNNPTGNLAKRLERSDHSLTMDDLIGWLGRTDASTATAADVRSFLRFQPDGRFTALAARERPFKRLPDGTVELLEPTVTQAEFRAVWETVRRHHCPVVIDAGNNDADAPWRAALAVTDQLVVPVQWRKDACDAAVRLLGVMEETGHGRLVDQAIVVNMTKPGPRPDKARARRYRAFFERAGLLVVDVPIDPVIAGDDAMAWSRLDPATREAGVRLCAEITRRTSRP
jgi:cellulose biosynthesis protein BcsQ